MFFLKLFLEKHFFNENLTSSFDRDHCISLQDIQRSLIFIGFLDLVTR